MWLESREKVLSIALDSNFKLLLRFTYAHVTGCCHVDHSVSVDLSCSLCFPLQGTNFSGCLSCETVCIICYFLQQIQHLQDYYQHYLGKGFLYAVLKM